MIDLSLSDESHAQHEDSSDQDFDEEHRIGGLGVDSGMVHGDIAFGSFSDAARVHGIDFG